jgi:hypothetical protein
MPTPAVAISTAEPAMSPARPYAPSWLHLLLRGLDRLPGPAWVWYAVLGLLDSLISHLEFWTIGRSPYGQVDAENVFWGFLVFAELWAAARFERIASAALDATRPALRLPAAEFERLRYELAVAPPLPAAIALVAAGLMTAIQFIADPEGSTIVGVPAPLVLAAFLSQLLTIGILLVVLLQLVRQMRLIRTTLDRSAIVDPFLPGPLSGFSRLTSQVGITVVVLVTMAAVITPIPAETLAFVVRTLPYIVVPPAIALIAFVVPLYGLHTRLDAEKERLQGEAEHRLKALLAALNSDVDLGDLARADGLNKQLGSMLQQREVLAKLPTWPWSTGTLRAVITAILLPIVLFFIQGVLARTVFS